jgi:hypothetical protein
MPARAGTQGHGDMIESESRGAAEWGWQLQKIGRIYRLVGEKGTLVAGD